jgi:type IX secretion system PorP/SprF family membrane protein
MVMFVGSQAIAQQTPQYSQNRLNYFCINPAMAGMKKCIDLKMGYRSQWVGFEGAPKTTFATVSTRLKFKNKVTPYAHHGLGVKVESDVMGLTSTTKLYLAYAYHFRLGRDSEASAGLFAGIEQFRFNVSRANAWQGPDPAISNNSTVIIWPDIAPGIFIHNKKMFFGFDIRQLLLNRIRGYGTGTNKLRHHFEFLGGAKIESSESMSFIPSAMVRFTPLSVPSIDLNLMIDLDNRAQLGLSYRNTDAVVAMFKVNFLKHFTLGYSFDFTTSKIKLGSSNTHEILIGIYACNVRGGDKYSCPVFD